MSKTVKPICHPIGPEDKASKSSFCSDAALSPHRNVFSTTTADSAESQKQTASIQAPCRSGLFREALALIELPRLLLRFPLLARQPRGRGQPVLVLPGFGCGNVSTMVLQSYLRYLGYRVRGCGRRIYTGEVSDLLRRVLKRVLTMAHRTQQGVSIIGWSLGGYLAREAARELPDLVHHVITLGTPVIGGPKYTVVAEVFRRRGIDVEEIALQVEARNLISLSTPITAIYSRTDAVVAWEACIDRRGLNVEHIEVPTTHIGLGFSAEVYQIIAQRLANDTRTAPISSPNGNIQTARPQSRRRRRRT